MSIIETTTRISRKWLERKPKHELASIIMANIDKIDLFAEERKAVLPAALEALERIEADGHLEHCSDRHDGEPCFCHMRHIADFRRAVEGVQG